MRFFEYKKVIDFNNIRKIGSGRIINDRKSFAFCSNVDNIKNDSNNGKKTDSINALEIKKINVASEFTGDLNKGINEIFYFKILSFFFINRGYFCNFEEFFIKTRNKKVGS